MPAPFTTAPWTDGPRELLQHAADHLRLQSDFDRRIAMISVDNAVELAIKTYLALPERARGSKGPSRKELDGSESFPGLLDLLERYGSTCLDGIELSDIEWYHRLRNQLYHTGNGITVELARVEAYFQVAMALFEGLFGSPPRIKDQSAIHTKTGEFMQQWARFERDLRSNLAPKEGLAYHWKREFLESKSKEAVALWESLSRFRNNLVHGIAAPSTSDLERSSRDLQRLMDLLQRRPA